MKKPTNNNTNRKTKGEKIMEKVINLQSVKDVQTAVINGSEDTKFKCSALTFLSNVANNYEQHGEIDDISKRLFLYLATDFLGDGFCQEQAATLLDGAIEGLEVYRARLHNRTERLKKQNEQHAPALITHEEYRLINAALAGIDLYQGYVEFFKEKSEVKTPEEKILRAIFGM